MSAINYAASRLVNPPDATIKLTEAQVWKGLEMKVRDPQNFVAAVAFCDVTSDNGTKVVRKVGIGKEEPHEEVVKIYPGTIIYNDTPSEGRRVTNVLSYGKNDELILTFSFVKGIPGAYVGDTPSEGELNKIVGNAVEQTIERIRELVTEGALQSKN